MKYKEISAFIMDESNNIIYLADPETYELIYLNKQALQVVGNPGESEWKGKPCYRVLQYRDAPCSFCTNHCLREEDFYIWEHYNENADKYFLLKDKFIRLEGRKLRLEIATDITEKEIMNLELQKQLKREEMLVICVRILNEEENLDSAIQKLLGLIGEYYAADRAYIFEIDYGNKRVRNTFEWCREGVMPEKENLQQVTLRDIARWLQTFQEKGEIFIDSLKETVSPDSSEYKILAAQGIESLMAVPMWEQNEITGFLGVDDPCYDTDTMLVLRSVSSFINKEMREKDLKEKLYELSYSDRLTKLGNRHSFEEKIRKIQQRDGGKLGIVYADINGLKEANDRNGHVYGDYLICCAAELLRSVFAENIYRIGGDEFVVLCVEMDEDMFAEKTQELCARAEQETTGLSLSIGSNWTVGGSDVELQIQQADARMYEKKQEYYRRQGNAANIVRV